MGPKRLAAQWLAIMVGVLLSQAATATSTLVAGVACAGISPAPGAFIAGDAKNRKFTGVHDDIFVKAAVFSDGTSDLAVVVVDCIGMIRADIEALRKRAALAAGRASLPAERIIVASTHTHCGPDVVGIWGKDTMSSGKDFAYMERLIDTGARQVALAAQRLEPVHARYASIQEGFDWVENICEPDLLDRTTTILQFLDESDTSVLTLTNFACHPTVMDGVTSLVSSDYVAGFYRVMEERLGGAHLFLQGAIGGWVQPRKEGRSFELADAYGASVARSVIAALPHAMPLEDGTIQFARKILDLPLENDGFKALAAAGVLDLPGGERLQTEVAWFRIGPVQFATHPGETSPFYSLETRNLMGQGPTFVLGLTLDALGYILKPAYFTEADMKYAEYLTSMSVGPRTGPLVMEALAEIIPGR